jgi:hypothetical protein
VVVDSVLSVPADSAFFLGPARTRRKIAGPGGSKAKAKGKGKAKDKGKAKAKAKAKSTSLSRPPSPSDEFPSNIPDLPLRGTPLASLEDLLTWHNEICRAERDYRAAVVSAEVANAHVSSSDTRRNAAWSRYVYLMGTALNDEKDPSGAGPSTQNKGKGKAPAISISSASGEEDDEDYDDEDEQGDEDEEDEVAGGLDDDGEGAADMDTT